MTLSGGRYRIGSSTGRLLVKTSRAGLGRKAGHDLTIEATRWTGEAVVALDDPSASSVTVIVETDSLEVREGTGGLKPLTDNDRAEIRKTFRTGALLDTAEHPTITFRSTRIMGTSEDFAVSGDLTIKGRTHPVTVHGHTAEGGRLRGHATLTQTTWGIKPYTAFLGALRLADEVRIEFDLGELPPEPQPNAA